MSFKADPVTDKNDIYEAYLKFANSPDLFMVSDCKPPCAVHMMRKCDGKYYWVPKEAGPAFLALVLDTTFMRGAKPAPPPGYYERTIADILVKDIPDQAQKLFMVKFAQPVKNGVGYLEVDLDGHTATLVLRPVLLKFDEFTDVPPVPAGQDTLYLRSRWSPSEQSFKPEMLKGKTVRVFLQDYPPPPPPPAGLQKIVDDLTAIRANQIKMTNP